MSVWFVSDVRRAICLYGLYQMLEVPYVCMVCIRC